MYTWKYTHKDDEFFFRFQSIVLQKYIDFSTTKQNIAISKVLKLLLYKRAMCGIVELCLFDESIDRVTNGKQVAKKSIGTSAILYLQF